jgi:hypothetical protein
VYHSGTHADHVRPMFGRAWMPLLAALSVMFEQATDADGDTVRLCLEGFGLAVRVACEHGLATEREAFVLALSKFTILAHLSDMQPKNVAAIHTLLATAYQNRNGLAESWIHVLACVSRLVRTHRERGGGPVHSVRGRHCRGGPSVPSVEGVCLRNAWVSCLRAFVPLSLIEAHGRLQYARTLTGGGGVFGGAVVGGC